MARLETVRVIFALVAQTCWHVYHFDVRSTFLNGEIQEEIYVAQPEGYAVEGKEYLVYRLRKALYGHKQAPRAWYNKVDKHFREHGYIRSETEHTLYRKVHEGKDYILISLYVDDIVYTSSSQALINEFKAEMMGTFDMSDLGLMSYFLGLEVHQTTEGIFVTQRKYVADLLNQLNMGQCKHVETPMGVNEKFQIEDDAELTDPGIYRSLIGKLLYLTHTRPDICYSVNYLSRFMSKPSSHHLIAVKRVMKYLAGTSKFGMWFSQDAGVNLEGFTDSDWGGSLVDRKSTSGMCFRIGSSVIAWGSKKQDAVALSTTEAEYITATSAACQLVWLRRIMSDFGKEVMNSSVLWCDNQSAIVVAKNPALHGRTKHIDVRFHFIRALVSDGVIVLRYCNTGAQLADIFTKPLPAEKHKAI